MTRGWGVKAMTPDRAKAVHDRRLLSADETDLLPSPLLCLNPLLCITLLCITLLCIKHPTSRKAPP